MTDSKPTPGASGSAARPVVTIFEEYGAGAAAIGKRVAEALGLPFHAQAFSSGQIAGRTGAGTDEAVLARVLGTLGGAYAPGIDSRDIMDTQAEKRDLVTENNRTLRAYADEGGVIVGRNGAVVLADRPRAVHVLLTGDVADRVERAARDLGISKDEAARRRAHEEDVRRQMSRTLYGWDPMERERYDLVLNVTRIGEDSAVTAIVDAVKRQSA